MLPPYSQTHFKKSVTYVTFHAFYKGNLSTKLQSTVSSSAVPYLSYFTARGWVPSGLGDLLLFILRYFFLLSKPFSTHTLDWNYFLHLLTEKGDWCRAFLDAFTESTDAEILTSLLWPDLSETFLFYLDHPLAQWMLWQVSSLWCAWKGLTVSFYDYQDLPNDFTFNLASLCSGHDFGTCTSLLGGVFSFLLRLSEHGAALIFLHISELFGGISKCLSHA